MPCPSTETSLSTPECAPTPTSQQLPEGTATTTPPHRSSRTTPSPQRTTPVTPLSRFCEFGETSEGVTLTPKIVLEENLRDRFVCGLEESCTQRGLLSETKLTYQHAIDIANAMELADEGASHIDSKSTQVHKVSTPHQKAKQQTYRATASTTNRNFKPCYRCLGTQKRTNCV